MKYEIITRSGQSHLIERHADGNIYEESVVEDSNELLARCILCVANELGDLNQKIDAIADDIDKSIVALANKGNVSG